MLAPCSPAGEPTLPQKAQKFIESLGLGDRPDVSPPQGGTTRARVLSSNIVYSLGGDNSAGGGLSTTCPASQIRKAVCTDITGRQLRINPAVS